jgi:hypothetical protein
VDDFLASRCSKEFVVAYLEEHPDVFDRVAKPGLRLSAVSEVDLAIRLHELGLLPETVRAAFVSSVTDYAFRGEDLYAVENLRIQSVFAAAELAEFRFSVRDKLLPRLAEVREHWQENRDSEERPDECLEPLLDSFKALKEEFAEEPTIVSSIDEEIRLGQEWISNHLDDGKEERPDRAFGEVEPSTPLPPQERDIFDDVDQ